MILLGFVETLGMGLVGTRLNLTLLEKEFYHMVVSGFFFYPCVSDLLRGFQTFDFLIISVNLG